MTEPSFPPDKYCLLAFKGTSLFKLSLKNQQCLVNKINEAYGKTFKKYNIIVGDRIADVTKFERDSGFSSHPECCYFYAFIEKDPSVYLPLKESTTTKREVFENYEVFFITEEDDAILNLNDDCIKALTAFKPHHEYAPNLKVIEPTCFVSFLPRLGLLFLPLTERHFQTVYDVEKYVIEVVKEHDLVGYYLKNHNYKLIGETHIPQIFDPESSGVPQDFKLNSSFHLSKMEKNLK